jgi:hypothetical protein
MRIHCSLGPITITRSEAAGVWEFSGPPNVILHLADLGGAKMSFPEGQTLTAFANAEIAERYMVALLLFCDPAIPEIDDDFDDEPGDEV